MTRSSFVALLGICLATCMWEPEQQSPPRRKGYPLSAYRTERPDRIGITGRLAVEWKDTASGRERVISSRGDSQLRFLGMAETGRSFSSGVAVTPGRRGEGAGGATFRVFADERLLAERVLASGEESSIEIEISSPAPPGALILEIERQGPRDRGSSAIWIEPTLDWTAGEPLRLGRPNLLS